MKWCVLPRDIFFPPKVVSAIMLVWKFLEVVTSVLLLGGDVIPQTLLQEAGFSWRENKVPDPGS